MKFFRIILLIIIFISPSNANTIYNLIKIPNLDIYETNTDNGLKYLKAYKPFEVGIRNNNVKCFNSNTNDIDKKFKIILKNFNKYSSDFLKKINLKYIVLCENLSVAGINTAGVPNHKMKTLIIDIQFNKNHFERTMHHEVFHIIKDGHSEFFNEMIWENYNDDEFQYAECSTCSDRLGLSIYKKTNGFLTEYSMSTANEDMAEVFSFLMIDNNNIKNTAKEDSILDNKVSFIKKNILKIDNKFIFK
tara:strand:+ start:132 stop:872 length:741 start_codon:yes stop_codon:yes gene_type:complete